MARKISMISSYKGNEPYVFISYAHADLEKVMEVLELLNLKTCRVWYDEGIEFGKDFPNEIATAIQNCSQFIVFISNISISRPFVNKEIMYANAKEKNILPIYLEETKMPAGIDFILGAIQGIEMYRMDWETFDKYLMKGIVDESFSDFESAKSNSNMDNPEGRIGKRKISYKWVVALLIGVVLIGAFFFKDVVFNMNQGNQIEASAQKMYSQVTPTSGVRGDKFDIKAVFDRDIRLEGYKVIMKISGTTEEFPMISTDGVIWNYPKTMVTSGKKVCDFYLVKDGSNEYTRIPGFTLIIEVAENN